MSGRGREEEHLRWFVDEVAQDPDHDLGAAVSGFSDIELRRSDVRIRNQYHDVDLKLRAIRYHACCIGARRKCLDGHKERWLRALQAERLDDKTLGDDRVVVEFFDLSLVAHFEAMLVQVKALLDSLAQLFGIAYECPVRAFSGGGRKLIQIMKRLSGDGVVGVDAWVREIEAEKELWIDEVIGWRDLVVHYGQLRGMRCYQIRFGPAFAYSRSSIADPVLPGGGALWPYVDRLRRVTHMLAASWVGHVFARLRFNEQG